MLRQLTTSLELGTLATLTLAGENVLVPADADVRVVYEAGGGARQLVVRVTWGTSAGAACLIHTHGDQVRDSAGRLYDVLVYGEERAGGTWEGWLEFAPEPRGCRRSVPGPRRHSRTGAP